MTTTVSAGDVEVSPDVLALLPISANLLPVEITSARRTSSVRKIVAASLVLLMLLVAGWDFQARQATSSKRDNLNALQAQIKTLLDQSHSFAELQQIQASSTALGQTLKSLTAQDLPWYQLLPSLEAVATRYRATTFTTVSAMLTSGTAAAAQVSFPGATTTTSVGSLTLTGRAPDKVTIAAVVDALGKVPGVANVYLVAANLVSGGGYSFTAQLDITTIALGGRFASPTTGSK